LLLFVYLFQNFPAYLHTSTLHQVVWSQKKKMLIVFIVSKYYVAKFLLTLGLFEAVLFLWPCNYGYQAMHCAIWKTHLGWCFISCRGYVVDGV